MNSNHCAGAEQGGGGARGDPPCRGHRPRVRQARGDRDTRAHDTPGLRDHPAPGRLQVGEYWNDKDNIQHNKYYETLK